MDNIDINGKLHDLHSFTGIVISTSERSNTVVSGSDSSVSNGRIKTTHSSRTTIVVNIVVRNNLGKEHHLHTDGSFVSCAVGNELRFLWMDYNDGKKYYLAVKNYTTDDVRIYDHRLRWLFENSDFSVLESDTRVGCLFLAFFLPTLFLTTLIFDFSLFTCVISILISSFIMMFFSKPSKKADEFVLETKRNLLLML